MKLTITLSFALLWFMPITSFAGGQIQSPYLNPPIMPMPQEIRDPFTPSILMFNVNSQTSGRGAGGFMRTPAGTTGLPQMRLRGFIDQGDDTPLALLEVAGARTYLVREGDDISINPAQPNSVIRITKIDRLSITVEAGILGSIRVQR